MTLQGGTVGQAYNQTLRATGGLGALTWSVTGGSLPAGLTLTSAGTISGTPAAAGNSNFTVTVTDTFGQSDTQDLSLAVSAANQGPGTGQNSGPTTGQNQGPTTGQNQGPTTGQNPGPTTGQNQGPVTGQDQGPGKGKDEGPAKGKDEETGKGKDKGPGKENK